MLNVIKTTVSAKKTKTKARNARRKKVKKESPPVIEQDPFSSMKRSMVDFLNSKEVISEAGRGSIERICNPCGEHKYTNARFPDGSVTQSGIMELRKTEFITPPFLAQAAVEDQTLNWSLFMISLPAFNGVGLLIANAKSLTPSNASVATICGRINELGVSTYPVWDEVITTQSTFNISYLRYESADLGVDDTTGESKNIQSFRVVGDGFVFHHNAPTIWDQGGYTVGQFQNNAELAEGKTGRINVVYEVTRGTTASAATAIRIYTVVDGAKRYILNLVGSTLPATPSTTFNGVGFTEPYTIYRNDGVPWARDVSPAPTPFPIQVWYTVDGSVNRVNFRAADAADIVIDAPLNTTTSVPAAYSESLVLGATELVTSHILTMPPFRMSEVAQADTKWDVELMKTHQGFYTVRRFFQPKLFLTSVSETGNVKFIAPGMDSKAVRDADGGIEDDALDRNGAIVTVALVGLSHAALPFVKANRFIEFLPAPNSAFAAFVGDAPERDEDAEEVFRHIQVAGPHAYPPDYNSLGFLATAISSLIEVIPTALRTTRTLGEAVSRASLWVADKLNIQI